MVKDKVKDAFGEEHIFDYSNAIHYGMIIYSKNAKIFFFIESKQEIPKEIQDFLSSMDNDLKLELPIIREYIPARKGFVIDIYQKK